MRASRSPDRNRLVIKNVSIYKAANAVAKYLFY